MECLQGRFRKACRRGCSRFAQRGLSHERTVVLAEGAADGKVSRAGVSLACLKVTVA